MIQEIIVRVNGSDTPYQTDTNIGDILKDNEMKGKVNDFSFIIDGKPVIQVVTAKTTLEELGVQQSGSLHIVPKSGSSVPGPAFTTPQTQTYNPLLAQQNQQNNIQPPPNQYLQSQQSLPNPLNLKQANAGQFPQLQQLINPLATPNIPNPLLQQQNQQPQPQQLQLLPLPQPQRPVQLGQVPMANNIFIVKPNILDNKIKPTYREPLKRADDELKMIKDFTVRIYDDGQSVELSRGNDKQFTAIFYEENATEEATNKITLGPSDMINNEEEVVRCNGTKVMFLTGYRGIIIKWYSNLITQFEFWFNE